MTQIPLLSGVTATQRADFNATLPINLEGVATESGISQGYLRSAAGAVPFGTGPGIDRGGIEWNGVLYRVMGTKLVSVAASGAVTIIGDVGGSGAVSLDYGFDRLAIRSGTSLWFYDGTTLAQVTDPDLGPSLDMLWMNGHYVSTDGTSVLVTQLSNPFEVDPLKYGSAESDPDTVTGLYRLRNELFVLGSRTIQVFYYQGGSGFPFATNDGATIPVGCVGARAKSSFAQSFAFVGSPRNEGIGVWVAQGGTASKLSTRQIDSYLAAEADPASIEVETRVSRDEERLLIHLTDRTLVYLKNASNAAKQPVWYVARSGVGMDQPYRPRHAVLCYNKFIVGDVQSNALGVLDDAEAKHFGDGTGWQFETQLVYNGSKGGIIHSLELVGLPGRGNEAVAFLSMTQDGQTWGLERAGSVGRAAQRGKRCQWRPHLRFENYVGLRFRGNSDALAGWAALEAEIESLGV